MSGKTLIYHCYVVGGSMASRADVRTSHTTSSTINPRTRTSTSLQEYMSNVYCSSKHWDLDDTFDRWTHDTFPLDTSSNGRASAVEFQWNPAVRPDADPASTQVVYATKQIVLSAGAFGSPTILERSGIGAHRILEKNGVTPAFGPKYELPGVGQNYQGTLVVLFM